MESRVLRDRSTPCPTEPQSRRPPASSTTPWTAATIDPLSGIARTEYDDNGRESATVDALGRRTEMSYALGRLVEESVSDPVLGARVTAHVYDAVSNRLSETVEGAATTYVYDANDRLSETTAGQTTSYSYDPNGNTVLRTSPGLQTPSTCGTRATVWRGLWTAQARGRMSLFEYDHEGIRQSRTANGVHTRFLTDSSLPFAQVLEELDGSGAPRVLYNHGLDLISQ